MTSIVMLDMAEFESVFNKLFDTKMRQLQGSDRPAPEVIDADELAKRMGVSKKTVWNWRNANKIPVLQTTPVRFNFPDVIEALKSKKKK